MSKACIAVERLAETLFGTDALIQGAASERALLKGISSDAALQEVRARERKHDAAYPEGHDNPALNKTVATMQEALVEVIKSPEFGHFLFHALDEKGPQGLDDLFQDITLADIGVIDFAGEDIGVMTDKMVMGVPVFKSVLKRAVKSEQSAQEPQGGV